MRAAENRYSISTVLILYSRPLKRQFPTNNQYIND